MERYVQNFPTWVSGVDFTTLESDPQSIFALSEDLKLIYMNPAWFRFARENNGEPAISRRYPIGADIGEAVGGVLRQFYIEHFQAVIQSGAPWEHDYECSSPELCRVYHEAAYRMHDRRGILVTNSLLIERRHVPPAGPEAPLEAVYRHTNGVISQCAYCRRFQRDKEGDVWDWNPAWVRHPPENVSHSLCSICFDYYFKHHETAPWGAPA